MRIIRGAEGSKEDSVLEASLLKFRNGPEQDLYSEVSSVKLAWIVFQISGWSFELSCCFDWNIISSEIVRTVSTI